MTQKCVLDLGYYSTVIYKKEGVLKPAKTYTYCSKYQETENLIDIKNKDTHLLEIDNKKYLIGEAAEKYNINLDKTDNELYKLCTLTGLGLIYEEENEFNIVANHPLNLFNKESKEKFEKYLKINKRYKINNKEVYIRIKNCLVFPQTLPVAYVNEYNDTIGILDIGGLTCQGVIVNSKKIMITSSKFTVNLGILMLQHKIRIQLNSKYNTNIQEYQIIDIIKNGLQRDIQGSKNMINQICQEHIDEIIKTMQLAGWNIEDMIILATGGGSLYLKKYLINSLSNVRFSNDPVKDNVKGLWKVAEIYYG